MLVFFKQKTAYEMRISDWSSDVCSSDPREREEFIGLAGFALEHQRVRHLFQPPLPDAEIAAIFGDIERHMAHARSAIIVVDRPVDAIIVGAGDPRRGKLAFGRFGIDRKSVV